MLTYVAVQVGANWKVRNNVTGAVSTLHSGEKVAMEKIAAGWNEGARQAAYYSTSRGHMAGAVYFSNSRYSN